MRLIATLIRSAADPCSGVFCAVRSAKARMLKFLSRMSGDVAAAAEQGLDVALLAGDLHLPVEEGAHAGEPLEVLAR